jgi:hypothetical protein
MACRYGCERKTDAQPSGREAINSATQEKLKVLTHYSRGELRLPWRRLSYNNRRYHYYSGTAWHGRYSVVPTSYGYNHLSQNVIPPFLRPVISLSADTIIKSPLHPVIAPLHIKMHAFHSCRHPEHIKLVCGRCLIWQAVRSGTTQRDSESI